jgi:hypothetical protein
MAMILPPSRVSRAAWRTPTKNALAWESTAVSHFSSVISMGG